MTAGPAPLRARLTGQFWRFVRFGFVGGFATLSHVSVVVLAVEAFGGDPRWVNPLGVALAMPVSYFGHYYFSFGSSHAHRSTVPRFIVISMATLLSSQALMHMSVDGLGASYRIGLVLFVLLMPLINFLLQQILVFDRKPPKIR
jgi:putative flippase GtrA